MKGALRFCLFAAFAVAAARHFGHWPQDEAEPRAAGVGVYGALSFALAAVVDRVRGA